MLRQTPSPVSTLLKNPHTRAHSPSSRYRQPHPVGSGRTDPCRHPQRACSAGRPRREDLCAYHLAIHPSGLPSCFTGLWTPKQPAHSLAPPGSVLVAPYGPGCLPVCPRMLSLCHLQVSPSPTRRKTGPPYLFPVVRGPTSESISSPISPTPRVSPASSSQWIGSLRLSFVLSSSRFSSVGFESGI